jgi:glycosyltransferase involved in cell wall biosynthesis
VAYDLSSLGLGHADRLHRTGIFRVVERQATDLLGARECEVTFTALRSPTLFAYTADFLRASPALRGGTLAGTQPGLGVVKRLLEAHASRQGGPGASVATKAYRRVLLHSRKVLEATAGAAFPARAPDADVFHSPRFALPAPARTGRAARFLTFYDLIPILLPDNCSPGGVRELEQIVRSLRPDDWAFAISESARDDLCEYRPDLDPARVIVTPLAADPVLFHPVHDPERLRAVRERYGIPEGPYLLSLNTLDPRKNMERAVRAFTRAAREGAPDLSFVLVGSKSPQLSRLGEVARRAGVAPERLVLAGYVADDDLAAVYSGALGFVFPSLYEGFGLPPLEAMQCGVPVITSNNSSLPEVVGGAGIMIDPTDEDALSQAMLDVYRDGRLRERLRELSLARAREFSWARFTEQTVAGYRAALA